MEDLTESKQPTLSSSQTDSNQTLYRTPAVPLYQRPVSAIVTADLEELKTLQEGWFVEFKERTPEPTKLARSISSFANSHGGLLVIGVKEDQKTRRMASFAPMTRGEADLCITRAREAVTSHVAPPAYYEARAIELESLQRNDDARWIVLISVPKGRVGPYLHSSGCIYVRVGDAAAPCPLSDLSQNERLWTEALHRKDRLKTRIEHLSQQFQKGTPSIHVAVLADEHIAQDAQACFLEGFRKIALSSHSDSAGAIFDHVQTLDTSFVARRTERQIEADGIVWDYDYRRRLHFIQIPIATHIWSEGRFDNRADLFGIERLASKLEGMKTSGSVMVTNLLPALFFLSIILRKVKAVHALEEYSGDLKLNASVVDAKGTVPFLGTPMYFTEADEMGVPYVLREVGFFHPLNDPSSWLSFTAPIEPLGGERRFDIEIEPAFAAFTQIAQSMGISRYVSYGARDTDDNSINTEPLSTLFAEVLSCGFSFTSQPNPTAHSR